MSEGRSGAGFTQRIAAAWLDAAEFAENRASLARPNKDEVVYWEDCGDRCEAQSTYVTRLPDIVVAGANR